MSILVLRYIADIKSSQFLDEKTRVALDRNEQEAVLRLAGIENLESCPFCPFAAEYPDIDVDREFRCQAPDCEKVSCRLCKEESHIPKSCDEYAIEKAKEKGLSERHRVEEAMSDALIRKCNKCDTSFIKVGRPSSNIMFLLTKFEIGGRLQQDDLHQMQ